MTNNIETYSFKTKTIIFFHIIVITYVGITSSISCFWAIMFLLYLIAVYIEIKSYELLKFYFKFNNFTIIFKNNKIVCFISAFIFAIIHQQYTLLDGKLFIFIFAIIDYYSFKKSKTIYAPMLYHFLNNFVKELYN
ncbi:hypothetical protein SAMN02745164_02127 [Marinitoga hydrogenitolerans DSM 16785]|uniref:CAAX prenyl protease 2/Lysostaphin resistance protein A-like domain-containing protein n=1 Tax=Marinitoga hydrogenitolerans (strain DSM 16785 / JCM 12826 / AT1271) TaxID=1122195 RepID=A0A1M5A8J8_MARH1|nr:CPBP family intramembrane glutamic endopeptidase [Marinitoga hydrogenitolerans]SHF26620.1 hypothetical protein SAMN02745164_02127 [Marinitoga hydrogenitolerans DSM 16785]